MTGGSHRLGYRDNHPEVVDRLAILNAAHPRKLSQGLHHPGQLRRSWYFFFDLPDLPEAVVHATTGTSSRHLLRETTQAYTKAEMDRNEAWSSPGPVTGHDQLLPLLGRPCPSG